MTPAVGSPTPPAEPRRIALGRRLLLLVVAAILPLAVVSGLALLALVNHQKERAKQSGLEITRALSTAVDAELQRSISVLEALATATLLDTGALEPFDAILKRVVATRPQWLSVVLHDPRGRMLLNTRIPFGRPMPFTAEKESLELAIRTRRPLVGHLARGALNTYNVPVRVPVIRNGQLRYVLTGVVKPEGIVELVNRQRLPEDWVVSVFDAKGLRVARSRRHLDFLGQEPSPTLKQLMQAGGPEGAGMTYALEGDRIYTAYSRSQTTGWTVAIGIPPSAVESAAMPPLVAYGGGIVLSIALGIAASVLIGRRITGPMAELSAAATALGRREPLAPPTTDIHEIRQVADSLVVAAEARARAEAERKRLLVRERDARAAAEASERRVRLLFEGSPVGLYRTSAAGLVQDVNPALVAMLGYPNREALIGRAAVESYVDPADREAWHALAEREEVVRGFEMRLARADGSVIWVRNTVRADRDAQGVVRYYEGALEDITDRKRAEEILRQSEERFRLVFDQGPLGMALVGPDFRPWRVNARFCAMLGYTAEELTKLTFPEFTHPDDVAKDVELAGQLFAGRIPYYQIEKRYRRKDGGIVWVRLTGTVIRDAAGRIHDALALVEDITQHKAVEASAQAARATSVALAGLAAEISASLDLDTVLQRVVDGGRNLMSSDLAGIALRDGDVCTVRYLSGGRKTLRPGTVIRPGLGMGGQALVTGRAMRTDASGADDGLTGDYRDIVRGEGISALLVVPIRHDEQVIGLFYVANRSRRPFTERDEAVGAGLAAHAAIAIRNSALYQSERQARAEAEAANRAKDDFLALVSHELRTPLTPILGWAHTLRTPTGRSADGRERALAAIERNARLQARLIDDLLDVSRIVTGKLLLDRRPVHLTAVIDAAVEAARPTADAQGLRLDVAFDIEADVVVGDPARLQQVVGNLLGNALKFTEPGGQIDVRLEARAGHAVVSVRDTGRGIPPELLARVFDRFRQANASAAAGGLGLGLTIARYLVVQHGGTIAADSPGPGRGSTFTVTLPLLPQSAPDPMPRAWERPSTSAPASMLIDARVLLVEDSADSAELCAAILRGAGAEVHVAQSADEALGVLGRVEADVLVSDIRMPGRDGMDLIREVRRRETAGGRRVPALALTAHASAPERDAALQAGFDAHLAKPIDPDALLDAVAALRNRADGAPPSGTPRAGPSP